MVIISAFTFNNKDHSWGAEQEGELTIAKLAPRDYSELVARGPGVVACQPRKNSARTKMMLPTK